MNNPNKNNNNNGKANGNLELDAGPTAAIAPEDYMHIYSKGKDMRTTNDQSPQNRTSSSKKTKNKSTHKKHHKKGRRRSSQERLQAERKTAEALAKFADRSQSNRMSTKGLSKGQQIPADAFNLDNVNKNSKKSVGRRNFDEQPTAMIAPSDYEHIYKNPANPQQQQQPNNDGGRELNDLPTAAIAPTDYAHIYKRQ